MKKGRYFLFVLFFLLCFEVQAVQAQEVSRIVNPYQEYSYEKMQNDIEALCARYPDIVKKSSIGKSVEGRDLTLVEFGKGERKIFLCGAIHAREYITTSYLMTFLEKFSDAYQRNEKPDGYAVRNILDKTTFYIVPMLNPDGVNLVQNGWETAVEADKVKGMSRVDGAETYGYRGWKANIHGVDLDRNFSSGWEQNKQRMGPASAEYKGPSAQSEPETAAVAAYLEYLKPSAVFSFHSQGKKLCFSKPSDSAKETAAEILSTTGFQETPATKPYGSMQDFVDEKLQVFYAKVELCEYVGPYPYNTMQFDAVWEPAKYICLLAAEGFIE